MRKATTIALIALSAGLVAGCNRGGDNMTANASAANQVAGDSGISGNEGVYLGDGGLTLRDRGTPTPFGTPKAQMLDRLTAILGPPAERFTQTDDCGPGVRDMVGWQGGLTVFFSADAFVGWSVGVPASGVPVRFETGLGPGSGRADLRNIDNDLMISQAQSLRITFDSERPDARVQEMWSGQTCAGNDVPPAREGQGR